MISVSVVIISSILFLSFKNENTAMVSGVQPSLFESPSSIKIAARILTEEEAKSNLASVASKQGYSVIALAIENSSPYQRELKQEGVDLELASRKDLMKKVKLSSLPRSIAYKIIGLFFWPAVIPGTIDGLATMRSEHLFKDRLYASTIKKEGEILIPYSTIQRYLFLPSKEVPDSFTIKLLNCRTLKYDNYNVEIKNT